LLAELPGTAVGARGWLAAASEARPLAEMERRAASAPGAGKRGKKKSEK